MDKARLTRHIRQALQEQAQVTLGELVGKHALQEGLAELVAYLQLGSDTFTTVVDETTTDPISWEAVTADGIRVTRSARLARMIFSR